MAKRAMMEVVDQDPVASLQILFGRLLEDAEIGAVLVAQHLNKGGVPMPALVTDPERFEYADPLAPAFPINAAKIVSRLSRRPAGDTVAAVLRPCEIRAFIELVKLKQGNMHDVLLLGIDCLGAFGNTDYARYVEGKGSRSSVDFLTAAIQGKTSTEDGLDISPACKACEHPVPENADVIIGMLGVDVKSSLFLYAGTPRGEELLSKLNFSEIREPEDRRSAVVELLERRIAYRDRMFEKTTEATADLEKLTAYLANCVNCYNCRVACPVCYCKECVFLTDVFDHEPAQYLRWARRKGILKMPSDTIFYHLTRLAHMSTACVGCGQCSNACPNNIPVMELFRTIAACTQRAFGYEAGRSADDEPPLSAFREREFSEVTGGKD